MTHFFGSSQKLNLTQPDLGGHGFPANLAAPTGGVAVGGWQHLFQGSLVSFLWKVAHGPVLCQRYTVSSRNLLERIYWKFFHVPNLDSTSVQEVQGISEAWQLVARTLGILTSLGQH